MGTRSLEDPLGEGFIPTRLLLLVGDVESSFEGDELVRLLKLFQFHGEPTKLDFQLNDLLLGEVREGFLGEQLGILIQLAQVLEEGAVVEVFLVYEDVVFLAIMMHAELDDASTSAHCKHEVNSSPVQVHLVSTEELFMSQLYSGILSG